MTTSATTYTARRGTIRRDEGTDYRKVVTLAVEREAVAHLRARFGLSERRACRIAGADRKMVRYRSQRAPETELRGRLRELAERRRFRSRRLFVLLRREGEPSGINRIYRLYREDGGGTENSPGDCFPDDTDGAQAKGPAQGRRHPGSDPDRGAGQCALGIGFRPDQFANGRRFRVLNVVDDVTRECRTAIPVTKGAGKVCPGEAAVQPSADGCNRATAMPGAQRGMSKPGGARSKPSKRKPGLTVQPTSVQSPVERAACQ